MRLLVVEDEKYLNKTLTERLTKAGYSVDSCFDGEKELAQNILDKANQISKLVSRLLLLARIDGNRQKFVKEDEFGSSGLGLSMVKSIIELHGGSVGVSSTPGEGTIFRITLNRD